MLCLGTLKKNIVFCRMLNLNEDLDVQRGLFFLVLLCFFKKTGHSQVPHAILTRMERALFSIIVCGACVIIVFI